MNIDQLAQELRLMYNRAPEDHKVAMIHLFGIKYAREMEQSGIYSTQIARRAGFGRTAYHSEISKGRKLAKYVDVKPEYL